MNEETIIQYCLNNNSLQIVKDYYNIHKEEILNDIMLENTFIKCCNNGFLNIIKWFFEIEPQFILRTYFNERVLISILENATVYGYYDMIIWLYDIMKHNNIEINIRVNNDKIFRNSCRTNNIMIAKFLCKICDDYKIFINPRNPYTIEYFKINSHTNILHLINNGELLKAFEMLDCNKCENISNKILNQQECLICMDDNKCKYKMMTPCSHLYCIICIVKWITENETCPYCRTPITYTSLIKL